MKKIICSFLAMLLLCVGCFSLISCGDGGGNGNVIEIEIDGGGDTGNFNTTQAQPFPYNELEVLLEEWEALNPGYTVNLRRVSYGGDQASLIPLLKARKAPDIIYQNGSVKESHIGNNYYVPYNDYLDKPNPYNDNKPWREVYQATELEATVASDGNYYYMNLERLAAGILYNKTFFEEHGLKVPETYGEFMEVQKQIHDLGKIPYLAQYPWYNIILETNIFSDLIDDLDTIRPNGVVDMEEMVRGYKKGIWTPDCEEYGRYLDLICEKAQYEPVGGAGYDPITSFLRGDTIMIEATGESMRKAHYNTVKGFEEGVTGYPYLSTEDLGLAGKEPGAHCYRGTAGTATSWWVTQSATRKGTVDACMDLMMFLTSPQYNNRMIGKMAGAIPLDPTAEVDDYLQPLVDMYNEDVAKTGDEKCVGWGAFSSWGCLGLEYNSFFLQEINTMLGKRDPNTGIVSEADKKTAWDNIIEYTETKVNALYTENVYDESKW